jgi:thiol-disulfide isomerase/thioredoxin
MSGQNAGVKPRFTGFLIARRLRAFLAVGLFALGVARAGASSLEEIAADPQQWPAEVTVSVSTKAVVIKAGAPAGVILIGAGRKLAVTGVAPDGVTGKLGATTVKVAVEKTNLLALAAPAPREIPAPARPAPTAPPPAAEPAPGRNEARLAEMAHEPPTAIQSALLGRLVTLENGRLRPYDIRKLNGVKFYGIMFSAGWCGPCRAFAPHLLESYRSLKSLYPEFELVLMSNDHSADDMLAYMREENMPWPAVKYSERGAVDELRRLGGSGIPDLVLIDGDGRVLADSFKGGDYLGPDSVLDAAWRVLKQHRHG